MDGSPLSPSLSEDTCASLDAIIVHDHEDYLLVEITSPQARSLIASRAGFLDRLLSLHTPSNEELGEEKRVQHNPFGARPSTNNWHPETSSRELSTDEYRRATRARLERVKASSDER